MHRPPLSREVQTGDRCTWGFDHESNSINNASNWVSRQGESLEPQLSDLLPSPARAALACIGVNRSREDAMRKMITLAGCSDGNCPQFTQWPDTKDFGVRGYRVVAEDKVGIPDTEDMVMIPYQVMLRLLAQLLPRLLSHAA